MTVPLLIEHEDVLHRPATVKLPARAVDDVLDYLCATGLRRTVHFLWRPRYAAQEGISVNQLISTALAEKLSALATQDHLAERAQRASRKTFEEALAAVPADEPDADDAA